MVSNPDGSTDTVYTNAFAEVMLQAHYDPAGGLTWDTFYEYNNHGQLILSAAPSAVNGYNDSYADLMNFQNGQSPYLNTAAASSRFTTTTARRRRRRRRRAAWPN